MPDPGGLWRHRRLQADRAPDSARWRYPLSVTLDSYGPIARSVGCCAVLDAVLAAEPIAPVEPRPIKGMRLGVPTTVMLDDLDSAVARAFERALDRLAGAGAAIERIAVPEFAEIAALNVGGGFSAAESWAWHRALIAEKAELYDPRVLSRILRGESLSRGLCRSAPYPPRDHRRLRAPRHTLRRADRADGSDHAADDHRSRPRLGLHES